MTNNTEQPNGKVGVTQFYQEVASIRREMGEMERRILSEIKEITRAEPPRLVQQVNGMAKEIECIQAGIDEAQERITDLRIKSNRVDGVIGLLSLLGTIISGILGTRS